MFPEPDELADRYVALWNEPDAELRRQAVARLYAPDATYVFYRRPACHGQAAIAAQITYTQELYRPMGYRFRSAHNATGHHNLVRFNWMMVATASGEVEMAGQDVLVLDEHGRIRYDYQFHDRLPSSFVYNDGYEESGVATRPARPARVSNVTSRCHHGRSGERGLAWPAGSPGAADPGPASAAR